MREQSKNHKGHRDSTVTGKEAKDENLGLKEKAKAETNHSPWTFKERKDSETPLTEKIQAAQLIYKQLV